MKRARLSSAGWRELRVESLELRVSGFPLSRE